jgi:hypothetical protein
MSEFTTAKIAELARDARLSYILQPENPFILEDLMTFAELVVKVFIQDKNHD